MSDWHGVKVGQGWMRTEDYCNSTERGNHLNFTSGIITADEELLGVELGWRVADYIIEGAVMNWDALTDALLVQYEANHT